MTNQDELLANLDALTEEQIKIGLAAGVWGETARPLVQHYLDQMKLERLEAASAEQLSLVRGASDAVRAVVDDARGAKLRASAALIIAAGAMVAAMAAAFVAFLAMRGFRADTLW